MSRRGWRPPPWYVAPAPRIRFVHDLRALGHAEALPSDVPGGFQVSLVLEPEGLPRRQVQIRFKPGTPDEPRVSVDGPGESPHRYADDTLCMWYPWDPRSQRWMPQDGSAELVARIAVHLIQEEWWRRTGQWVGDEISHGPIDSINDPKAR